MSVRPTAEIRQSLLAKGFRSVESHHEMFRLWVGGKKTSISTKISQGAKEYGDSLLGLMARQVGLKRGEFESLVECPLTAEAYIEILLERGRISLDPPSRPTE
jgi:hypothetical protein